MKIHPFVEASGMRPPLSAVFETRQTDIAVSSGTQAKGWSMLFKQNVQEGARR
jgi:hypothetical protein